MAVNDAWEDVDIYVPEGDDAVVTVRLTQEDGSDYPTEGKVWEFIGKEELKHDPDDEEERMFLYSTVSDEISTPRPGEVQIQFTAADIADPGVYRYLLREGEAGSRQTRLAGKLHVVNT